MGCRLRRCACRSSAGAQGAALHAKLTASLSLSLSPYPCPSPVPRLRDWNAEGSFISCLQDLTAGSWQEGVTRRLLPTHTTASGAQGQEQEQVLMPAMELMRISSAEDSDWQPQHPAGGWQEKADSRFFGQVRVGAGDSALQEVATLRTAFSGACCKASQADQVLALQVFWHTSCPWGCLSAQNSPLCLIPELLLSIYKTVTLPDFFLIEYLPWLPAQQPAGARNRAGLGARLGGGLDAMVTQSQQVQGEGKNLSPARARTAILAARPCLEVAAQLCRVRYLSHS